MNTINGPGNSSHTKRLYISYLKVKYVCILKTQTHKIKMCVVKYILVSFRFQHHRLSGLESDGAVTVSIHSLAVPFSLTSPGVASHPMPENLCWQETNYLMRQYGSPISSYIKAVYLKMEIFTTGKEQVKCFLISYSGVSLVIKFSLEVYLMRLIRYNGWYVCATIYLFLDVPSRKCTTRN